MVLSIITIKTINLMANRKRNISFARPEEPEFIKKLKQRAGIVKGPDVDTKREELPKVQFDDLEDKDEEKPVVVVIKKGDLSEDEVKQFNDKQQAIQEQKDINDGKIVFKKPDLNLLNEKNAKSGKKITQQESQMKSINNKSLLSFDDNEDEEDFSD
ncbi:uncharacterized protein KIAA1143 homolog [Oppia nitens]|uniref:uncharacterized protein KIAA1143 homolog n=1 Tax=Oppia nitens TaxID=1686743 RepID=UPI0023DC7141|nr:uncharacterized protein KIAA1143 homolog [Oppia nitens]